MALARAALARAGAGSGAPWGVVAAGLGVLVWLIVQPRTPDLAAQVYRVNLFRQIGFAVWDERWYAGHDLPGYSLTFPPLATLLGIRAVGALAALASAGLFERIARGAYGKSARWGAVWFGLAAVGDLWVGRLTFALGVALALGAALALVRARPVPVPALALAALCAASSPVAGLLLAMAGVTWSLQARRWRGALVLGVPVVLVVGALAGLFPEGGSEPYPTLSFLATLAVVLGFLLALPKERPLERIGALVYLLACVAGLVVKSPMGSNIERYAVLLAGPVLLCTLLRAPAAGLRGPAVRLRAAAARRSSALIACVLVGAGVWTLWGPVRETAAVAGNASTEAGYYVPVERFVAAHGGAGVRVEVPFTRSHWEAAWLAPTVSLARGWEKQLDVRFDGVLLAPGLTAAGYQAWLRREAVSYVALPDTPLDPSSAREGRLIEAGLPYLRQVLVSSHWRIYRVLNSLPLAEGPGRLNKMGHDSFGLQVDAPGRFVVRVHYTPYWSVMTGSACVGQARGGWTMVIARARGSVTVGAGFSLRRALGGGGANCRQADH